MLSVDQLEDKLIDLAFAEDIGDGDHTTLCCIPEDAMGKSHLLIKEDGVLAGVVAFIRSAHMFMVTYGPSLTSIPYHSAMKSSLTGLCWAVIDGSFTVGNVKWRSG